MSRFRLGPITGDLWKVLAATVGCLVLGVVSGGSPRAFFFGLGAVLSYISLFLFVGELAWGRDGLRLWSRRPEPEAAATPESPVLQVMRRVMHVRPEPFSGTPERDRASGRR